MFIIENERTSKGVKIYFGYNFKKIYNSGIIKEVCYVAEKDNFFAHGVDIKTAISDLQFKIVSEKLKNEPITEETIITINYYRLITGACEFGTKSWIKENIKPEKQEIITAEGILAKDLFDILEKTNAYGFNKFKDLVTFNK